MSLQTHRMLQLNSPDGDAEHLVTPEGPSHPFLVSPHPYHPEATLALIFPQ